MAKNFNKLLKVIENCKLTEKEKVKQLRSAFKVHSELINAVDEYGLTLLHYATEYGYIEVIKELLYHGAEINATNSTNYGWTSLHCAIGKGYLDVAVILLRSGANANAADYDNWTPLYCATRKGCLESVKLLLEHGAKVDTATSLNDTPLYCAIQRDYIKIVAMLLKYGANINATDATGNTPLHWAVKNNRFQIAEYLLNKGADYTIQNSEKEVAMDCLLKKQTPQALLDFAIERSLYKLAELSISAGANVNYFNRAKNTSVLSRAVQFNSLEIVQLLVRKGANIGFIASKGSNFCNMLHLAAHSCNLEIMGFFIGKGNPKIIEFPAKDGEGELSLEGIDVNETDFYDDTTLHTVIKSRVSEEKKIKAIKLLLENGANINAIGDEGRTPLHYSVQLDNYYVTEFLLEKGADVNCQDNHQDTTLHKAAKDYSTDIVRILLKVKDIKFDLKNEDGQTPLHIAIESGYGKMVKLFVERTLEQNPNAQKPDFLSYIGLSSYWNKCQAEIEKMKEYKLGKSVSLFDILTTDEKKLVSYINENIRRELESKLDVIQGEFPVYANEISTKAKEVIEKWVERKDATDRVIEYCTERRQRQVVAQEFGLLDLNEYLWREIFKYADQNILEDGKNLLRKIVPDNNLSNLIITEHKRERKLSYAVL